MFQQLYLRACALIGLNVIPPYITSSLNIRCLLPNAEPMKKKINILYLTRRLVIELLCRRKWSPSSNMLFGKGMDINLNRCNNFIWSLLGHIFFDYVDVCIGSLWNAVVIIRPDALWSRKVLTINKMP